MCGYVLVEVFCSCPCFEMFPRKVLDPRLEFICIHLSTVYGFDLELLTSTAGKGDMTPEKASKPDEWKEFDDAMMRGNWILSDEYAQRAQSLAKNPVTPERKPKKRQ